MSKRKPRLDDIVEVIWEDACSGALHWTDYMDVVTGQSVKTYSCGRVVELNEQSIVLCLSMTMDYTKVAGAILIPRGCIKSVRVLDRGGS